jgi:hypothetical protein
MGLDTHMIAGGRACFTSTRITHPTVTNDTSPHFAEALGAGGSDLVDAGQRLGDILVPGIDLAAHLDQRKA